MADWKGNIFVEVATFILDIVIINVEIIVLKTSSINKGLISFEKTRK